MGNVLAGPAPSASLADVQGLVLKDTLGGGRFLRTLLCVHDEMGLVVVKVYHKRQDSPVSLEPYKQQLQLIRSQLLGVDMPHVWPFQLLVETRTAGYLVRQYLCANLYDRLSTRPFLSSVEKRWITYQLLHALAQCHERGVCHGDIKAENVLLTSWGWTFLADFAPYKPVHLPADNPAEFSYFFDTGGRRRCYIAPERFYVDCARPVGPLTPQMDVFSLGCVIAELYLDGKAFLDLGQLLALKSQGAPPPQGNTQDEQQQQQQQQGADGSAAVQQGFGPGGGEGEAQARVGEGSAAAGGGGPGPLPAAAPPSLPQLSSIDPEIRALVQHMVQVDPASRWSARDYLRHWQPSLFPPYFDSLLHPFFASLLPLDTDARVEAVRRVFPEVRAAAEAEAAAAATAAAAAAAAQAAQSADCPVAVTGGGAGGGSNGAGGLVSFPILLSSGPRTPGPSQGGAGPQSQGGPGDRLLPTASTSSHGVVGEGTSRAGAGGGAGAAAPAVPGPASPLSPGARLLDDMGALLDNTHHLMAKQGAGPDDDGAFLLDEEDESGRAVAGGGGGAGTQGGPGQQLSRSAAGAGAGAGSIDEVVMEEVMEYQSRDAPGGSWSPDLGELSGGRPSREQVTLPQEPGWSWAGEWVLDTLRTGQCDAEGWEYRDDQQQQQQQQQQGAPQGGLMQGSAAGPAGVQGPGGARGRLPQWTPACTDSALWRRRKWLRQRRRRILGTGPPPSPGLPLASSPTSLGPYPSPGSPGPPGLWCGSGSSGGGLALLVVLLCTLLRGARLFESKRVALSLLVSAALQCEEEVRLQAVVPYLVTLLGDAAAGIRTLALRCLVRVMCSIDIIPPSDAKVFQDYLIPSLSLLPNDVEEAVRVEYALGIAQLAAAAHKHLMRLQQQVNREALGAAAAAALGDVQGMAGAVQPFRYDCELGLVRSLVEGVVKELVISARSSTTVKRALLCRAPQLAVLFGRRDLNDKVLPLLITCLNAMDWALRSSFFKAVSCIGAFTGHESLDVFLLPCLEQALLESGEEAVVADAVRSIATVVPHLRRRSLLGAASKVAPLLGSPTAAVRAAAVSLLSSAARCLSPADVYAQLLIMIQGWLIREPCDMGDERELAACLRAPEGQQGQGQGVQQGGAEMEGGVFAAAAMLAAAAPAGAGGWGPNAADPLCMWTQPAYAAVMGGVGGVGGVGLAAGSSRGDPSRLQRPSGGAPSGSANLSTNSNSLTPQQSGAGAGSGPRPSGGALTGAETTAGGGGLTGTGGLMLFPVAPVYQMELDPGALAAAVAAGSTAPRQGGRAAGGGGGAAAAAAEGELGPGPTGTSLHRAAIDSISPRMSALEARASQLAEGLSRDPSDASDRHQLDRVRATLFRLRQPASTSDVRDPSSLHTFQLLQLATRTVPLQPLAPGSGWGQVSRPGTAAASAGAAGVAQGSEAPGSSQALSDAMAAALSTTLPGTSSAPGAAGLGYDTSGAVWRPRGVLVAHLAEHRQAVNRMALAHGRGFFVSGSSDGTVKVWDLRRLERDVSFQSRLTYAAQPGRITAVSAVEDDSSVASASAAGSIHVWRVEYTTRPRPRGGTGGGGGTGGAAPDRYTGVVAKRQLSPGLGAVLDVQQWGSGLMLYGTQRGGVHGWDLRSRGDVWSLRSPSSQGLVEQLVSEPCLPSSSHGHWLLTGSTRGFLTLWDVRFQLPVRTWQHPMRCAIDGLAVACAPPGRLGLSLLPSSPAPVGPAGGPLVYVAAGRNEVGLWDVAAAHCRQVIRCLDHQEVAALEHTMAVPGALQPTVTTATSFHHNHLKKQDWEAATAMVAGRVAASAAVSAGIAAQPVPPAPTSAQQQLQQQPSAEGLVAPQPRPAGVRCMVPLPSGHLLTGSSDRGIRHWDSVNPSNSYLVCGPLWGQDSLVDPAGGVLQMPHYRYTYGALEDSVYGVRVVEERCHLEGLSNSGEAGAELRQRLRVHDQAHADAVLHMLATETPGSASGKMLLTCSRDGVVKMWK